MPTVAKWMVGYGIFLIVCGVAAWTIAGFESRAVTAVAVGGGTGVLAILMGVLSAAENQKAKMIGIHLGMGFIGLFTVVFVITGISRWRGVADDGPLYLPIVLTVMAIGSIVTLIMVIRERPPMEKRGAGDEPLE